MKKTQKIILFAVAAILAAGIIGILIYNNSTPVKYNRQLDLGNKYLAEQDYEQAKVAYEQAIEIDPMGVEAYIGLADVYIGLNKYEPALSILQKGFELIGDERLEIKIKEITEMISGQEEQTITDEKEEESKEIEEDEAVIPEYMEYPLLTEYENYGAAYSRVIPIMKNGLWGAINYSGEEIVPCEYMGFEAAANRNGYFVLSNSTFETITTTLMDMTVDYEVETKEYTLFDSEGNIIYCGTDDVRASGDMYITMNDNPPEGVNGSVTYHRMDGTEVLTVECDLTAIRLNGFYDGISTVYEAPMDEEAMYRIGTVDMQGNVSWGDDPERIECFERYAEFLRQQEEEKKQKAVEAASGITWNGSGTSGFLDMGPRSPMSTMNHGYYVTNNLAFDATYIQLYNENHERITAFNMYYAVPDEAEGFVISKSGNMEQYSFRKFFCDGNWLYNYGPKMVFVLGEKDILVDFTKSPGMTEETMNNSIIQAVYDRIYMGDSQYWLAKDENGYYYLDHDGNVVAEYEAATQFCQGFAGVIKNGHAYVINEAFEDCVDLGEAQQIASAGEAIAIQNGDVVTFFGPKIDE